MNRFKAVLKDLRSVWMLLLVGLLLFILTPAFLTVDNLMNVVLAVSVTALLAIGQTYVIILGEIDLSVGAILGFTSLMTAMAINSYGFIPGLIVGIGVGALVGLLNGLAVTKANMPSFIVTLASMSVLKGLTLYITQGNPVAISDQAFLALGTGRILGVLNPVWILAVSSIAFGIILARSRYGRQVYATGDNIQAARLSGIPTDRIKIQAFVIVGILSALGGFILAARLGSAQPTAGAGLELTAIAAVIIGGTRLSGGKGALLGTVIGALLLGLIDNGLNILNISSFLQDVVKGAVILLAVFIDRNALPIQEFFNSRKRAKTNS